MKSSEAMILAVMNTILNAIIIEHCTGIARSRVQTSLKS